MNIAFYNAYSAMQAYQQGLNVVAENLANVSTTGYKEVKAAFQELMYTKMNTEGDHNMMQGHGVRLGSLQNNFVSGILTPSNRALDFAVAGDGFFAVQINEAGDVAYTREGGFQLGKDGEEFYLTRTDGTYVLNEDMERIQVPYKEDSGAIDMEGIVESIGVFSFSNPYALDRSSDTTFRETALSGEAYMSKGKSSTLLQGSLETSNADMIDSMVAMMETQKVFQVNSRMVQTADQMEEIINNLR